jgi:ribosomal protein S21|tara:strand:- start:265 stop:471 length:207 start_codon:yes stop_codon:yes gene_type:complete
MEVKIRRNESSENLIKRFTRKVKKSKIVEEYIERSYFKKPSEISREKYFQRLAKIEKQKQKEKQERND